MRKKLSDSAWAIGEHLCYPLLMLAATPWFIEKLGILGYGQWMFLIAIAGLGGIMNAGTGAATIKSVSADIGRGQGARIETRIRAAVGLATLGGGAFAVLISLVFLLGSDALFARMGDSALVTLTGICGAVLLWIEQLDNVFGSALKGAERFKKAAQIEVTCRIGQIATLVLVSTVAPTLAALYTTLIATSLLRLAIKAKVATDALNVTLGRPSAHALRDMAPFAGWGWMQGLGSALFSTADRLLVGSFLGAAALAQYAICVQLAMQIHTIAVAALSVMFPMISRRIAARAQPAELWKVAGLAALAGLVLSTLLAVALLALSPLLLANWLGATSSQLHSLMNWLAVSYWILALNIVPYYLLLAFNQPKFISLAALGGGLIALATATLGIIHLDQLGAALGKLAYAIVLACVLFVAAFHQLSKYQSRAL